MELPVESFNRFLNNLTTDYYTPSLDTLDFLDSHVLNSDMDTINLYNIARRNRAPQLKIYYPISRYDEFPPVGVSYDATNAIAPKDLFNSIAAFYKQPLSQDNVMAYAQENSDIYDFLRDESRPSLRDVMVERINIESLSKYEDGYILNLGS